MKHLALLTLLFLATRLGYTQTTKSNWTGNYVPCDRHSDLLNWRHVDLGVRISTANPLLARQFASAMEFWTGVLDLEWHAVDSPDCALQLVDGPPALFNSCACLSARSQLPDRPDFQGWIAFNPRFKLSARQMFLDSVHEIGHLLGLPHNSNDRSVMFAFELDQAPSLDSSDLDALAAHHQLRPEIATHLNAVRVIAPPLSAATLK